MALFRQLDENEAKVDGFRRDEMVDAGRVGDGKVAKGRLKNVPVELKVVGHGVNACVTKRTLEGDVEDACGSGRFALKWTSASCFIL